MSKIIIQLLLLVNLVAYIRPYRLIPQIFFNITILFVDRIMCNNPPLRIDKTKFDHDGEEEYYLRAANNEEFISRSDDLINELSNSVFNLDSKMNSKLDKMSQMAEKVLSNMRTNEISLII